jgi:hypothetical protein
MLRRHVVTALILASAASSCGSEPTVAPTLDDLQGEWSMSWTEAGDGVSCAWTDVTLSLPDSAKGQPARWGGGHGSCDGLVDSDNLVLVRFVVDSLTVEDGHIVFVPQGSTYRFEGRVTAEEMSGTMSANPFYPDAGTQVMTMGRWQAVRAVSP